MNVPQSADLTKNAIALNRITDDYRPGLGFAYPSGTVVCLPALDAQAFLDMRTVIPSPAAANVPLLIGAVSAESISKTTGGFDGLGNAVSGANAATRGTQKLALTIYGQHDGVLIDNSGAGSAAIVHGTMLTSSPVTSGSAQGVTVAPPPNALLGSAVLPLAGLGATFGAGALVAAAITGTLTTAAAGQTVFATLQIGDNQNFPGIVQTRTVSVLLNATTGASVTSAAAALAAAINADPTLNQLYVATSALGVVTITALATGFFSRFFLTSLQNTSLSFNYAGYRFNTAGTGGNGLTTSFGGSGGAVATGGGALAGGTGYKGTIPAFISATL